MNDSNPWVNQLRSWTPRPPSKALKRKLFPNPVPAKADAAADLIVTWRWLTPVLGCLLILAGVFNSRDRESATLTAADTNNLLAVLTTQRTYAAYVTAGFHSRQNAVGSDTFEWTNSQGLPSSVGSFSPFNTNSLMR